MQGQGWKFLAGEFCVIFESNRYWMKTSELFFQETHGFKRMSQVDEEKVDASSSRSIFCPLNKGYFFCITFPLKIGKGA